MKSLKFKIALSFLCTSTLAFAQGIYVEINAGYGMPFNSTKDLIGNSTSYYDGQNSTYTYKNVNLSVGQGANFGATVGYMFNPFIGAELQYSYLIGTPTSGTDKYTNNFGGMLEIGNSEGIISGDFSRIIPAIVLQTNFEKINPYAKIGVVLGFGCVEIENNENRTFNGNTSVSHEIRKLNGGLAVGLNTRFGVLISGPGKVSYFLEANCVSMNYSPTKGEVTTSTANGVDMLPFLTTEERYVEFEDEITYSNNSDPNQPSQESKITLPFGSIGLNIGVRVKL